MRSDFLLRGRVERISRRLASLRDQDPEHRLFGASSHHHLLFSPTSEVEAVAFEQRQGVALPEEYRAYVTQLSTGGAGPGHGLYAFSGSYWDQRSLCTPNAELLLRLLRTPREQEKARRVVGTGEPLVPQTLSSIRDLLRDPIR